MGDALMVGGGVTTPKEARLAMAGLLALQSASMLDARTGVMVGPGSTQLVTGTADTGPMAYAIAPHVPVTSRGAANGPYIGPVPEAITKVTTAAAPGSNSRIDVIYELQQDATTDVSPNATTAPLYGVLNGTASAIPVKPDLLALVGPGALELATATVAAGATKTNGVGVTITNTVRQTTTRGGIVPVKDQPERVAIQTAGWAYPTLQVLELDTGRLLWHDGTRFRYDGDRVTVSTLTARNALTAYAGLTAYVTATDGTGGDYTHNGTAWNDWTAVPTAELDANGWINAGSPWAPCRYRQEGRNGRVQATLLQKNAGQVFTQGAPVFTLPLGLAPGYLGLVHATTNGGSHVGPLIQLVANNRADPLPGRIAIGVNAPGPFAFLNFNGTFPLD